MEEVIESTVKKHVATQRDLDLLDMPPLYKQMPVKMKNGFKFTQIRARCEECGNFIADDQLHGEFVPKTDQMTEVHGRGYCKPCHIITQINYRLYDDGRFVGLINGKWMTNHMMKIPLWKKILEFLF